ncbi:MAG: hypothetical protein AAFU38_07905 [Bacteroidota bacterium]
MTRLFLISSFTIALAACSLSEDVSPFVSEPGGLLETDRTRYNAQVLRDGHERIKFDVPFVAQNPTGAPLYLMGCNGPHPPVLEKYVDGTWKAAYDAVIQTCQDPPHVIPRGGERADTLRVIAFLPGQNALPTFDVEIEGMYRLRWKIYASLTDQEHPVGRDPLSAEQQLSNTFEVY